MTHSLSTLGCSFYNDATEITERRRYVVSTNASYSGGTVFKSRPGIPTLLRFLVVFLDPWRQYPGQYLMLGHAASLYIFPKLLFTNCPIISLLSSF
jgi:hypothetical protein